MDLVDLFIGAEGTLGVLTEVELQLLPAPLARWGLMMFFPDQAASVRFVEAARAAGDVRLAALEFFDARALALLRGERAGVELLRTEAQDGVERIGDDRGAFRRGLELCGGDGVGGLGGGGGGGGARGGGGGGGSSGGGSGGRDRDHSDGDGGDDDSGDDGALEADLREQLRLNAELKARLQSMEGAGA